ncbi:MAG: hypothetical protein NVSMB29_16890 [Candidatus Dormibacteria bacterium]
MDAVVRALHYGTSAAFVLLGLLAARDWLRDRDRAKGWLALAIGLLGVTALAGQLDTLGAQRHRGLGAVTLVAFAGSGYALLRFRDVVIPLTRFVRWLATATVMLSTVFVLAVGRPLAGARTYTSLQLAAILSVVVVWSLCVGEPAVRLWLVSGGRPAVQRARLRSLSVGYAAIVAVLVLSAVGSRGSLRESPGPLQLVVQIVALAVAPLLYASFAPPRWLRRVWREREEEGLRRGIEQLLLFSPDRVTLAHRALDWALRLVGGDAGFIADEGATLLSVRGMTEEDAQAMAADPSLVDRHRLTPVRGEGGRLAIVHPLPLETGTGSLVVISGSFSPVFTSDEVDRLGQYAAAITVALDRARLVEAGQRSEEELRAARDAAESASRSKSEFLSRMSHELRTPLTAILGFSDLLAMDQLADPQREYVEAILRAGSHLLALINDVLDIARIEEGGISLSVETLDIDEVIDEVLRLTAPLAAARSIELVAPHREPEGRVLADHQRVKQILLNLISNAIKYNREGGQVALHSQPMEGGGWRLEVKDTGPGLSAEDQAKLFSPFERLAAATTEIEGTGLGLALSRTMAEAMGGTVGVRSELGRGSTFWVRLPAAVAARAVRSQGRKAADPVLTRRRYAQERRVLYVEDTASNLRLVEGIVSRRPSLRMETAQTGEEALRLAGTLLPDLVLLDLHLPDLPGEEVLSRLRAAPPTAEVPVIVLSADATRAQADRLLAAGASDYLTKPIDVPRLLGLLDTHLDPDLDPLAAAAASPANGSHPAAGASAPGESLEPSEPAGYGSAGGGEPASTQTLPR